MDPLHFLLEAYVIGYNYVWWLWNVWVLWRIVALRKLHGMENL